MLEAKVRAYRIPKALFVVLLVILSCLADAMSRSGGEAIATFRGMWAGRRCARDDSTCGSFSIVLAQRGRIICGSHASATPDLSRVDEGDAGSIVGTVTGNAAVVTITSGRNGASYVASISLSSGRANWSVIGPASVPATGDSDLIPTAAILSKVDSPEARDQMTRLAIECKWKNDFSETDNSDR